MQIVYATGQPRYFEFAFASKRKSLPSDATIFAVCLGENLIECLDEELFGAMSDEEYGIVREMIAEATRVERERLHGIQTRARLPVGRMLRWFAGRRLSRESIKLGLRNKS
jgi:hypothetical protein